MHIREWQQADLPRVGELMDELCAAIGHPYHADPALLQQQFDHMLKQPDIYRSYVCIINGTVAGFVSLVFYASILHRQGTALINELVVGGSYRGRGVGRALMEHALTLAKRQGWDELEVGVERENTAALDFYKACGLDQEYVLLGREFDEENTDSM